jgi:NAD(P)-dependent dehydrogenase (short-subunit alcohol dehydrogenase family)
MKVSRVWLTFAIIDVEPKNYVLKFLGDKMKKTIVITGGSDGIGAAAARQLKALGHHVVIVGRNAIKTEKLAKELEIPYHIAHYAKLQDVVRLAKELDAYPRIDVLVNNAGAIMKERTITEDGYEQTFQINVLAGFMLTTLLIDKLCTCKATVVQTSSIAANLFGQTLDIKDLQNEKSYTPVKAYSEAKLCDILLTRELHRRYHDAGICAVAFEPGIPRSNFASEASWLFKTAYHTPLKYLFTISPEKSANRMIRLALGTEGKDFLSGLTYSNTKPYKVKYKDDGKAAMELWDKCEMCYQVKEI